ncbi:GNAT family N-acetyltransferase [Levilactobacillus hammesii]|uniref:N-acetyltransferase domain-containing protein n=1 Tax=Levilactobacillus hammesii DSM 16381 TaxID=1423753 RepID=A0A0R1UWI6_9LACO|nr:GNAT family N-acetyltransferase [Levilactobacillus hammesii]KRL97585.1 hypothetical protein FD28_GL001671 [Levilactobacillus hammesii DSM 16381]
MTLVYQKITRPTPAQKALLLTADPSQQLIDQYLPLSTAFAARDAQGLVGVLVLRPRAQQVLEIANLAITPNRQRHGFAKVLLEFARQWAIEHGYRTLRVATGSTSLVQLKLYQQCGYRMITVEPDYFTKTYSQDIFENGLKLRDRVILERKVERPQY